MVFSDRLQAALYLLDKGKPACLIRCLSSDAYENWKHGQSGPQLAWAETTNFKASAGEILLLPDSAGGVDSVLLGLGSQPDAMALAALPGQLPPGAYRLADDAPQAVADFAALAWAMGCYRFTAYKSAPSPREWPQLVLPKQTDVARIERLNAAVFLARDLINTPAADMGPEAMQRVVEDLAQAHGASFAAIIGDDLLTQNYPMIHAVGRAAMQAPRLLDLRWGREDAPRVTLIGKGVCFDTGGLNLKPGHYMELMKKDMGGAAIAIALAGALMSAGLDIRLRLLVGAVENAIGPDAFRPGDVLPSRKGLSVEIANTDAEGRLVLADMLAEADRENPELMVNFATLTGAARVAMGPEVVPFYTTDDGLAAAIQKRSHEIHDPMWRMPLWAGYQGWLDSQVGDVNHVSNSPMAGSITAALFLSRFVEPTTSWMHCDVYAWNIKPRAGRPVGGEAQTLRSLYTYLEETFGG
jgi:leucyl aminopeptidase